MTHAASVPLGLLMLTAAASAALLPYSANVKAACIACAALGVLGGCLQAIALDNLGPTTGGQVLLSVGAALQGPSFSVALSLRHAVTADATATQATNGLGIVVCGGLIAVVVGPEISKETHRTANHPRFFASFFLLAALHGALLLTLLASDVRQPKFQEPARLIVSLRKNGGRLSGIAEAASEADSEVDADADAMAEVSLSDAATPISSAVPPPPPTPSIEVDEQFVALALLQSLSYAPMVMLMCAAPLAMRQSYDTTTTAIQIHMVAMFLPAAVAPRVIEGIGAQRAAVAGFVAEFCACVWFVSGGRTLLTFYGALVVLGVGWTLAFIASTALMTQFTSRRARAVAEGGLLTAIGVLSLIAAVVEHELGWGWLAALALALIGLGLMLACAQLCAAQDRRQGPADSDGIALVSPGA